MTIEEIKKKNKALVKYLQSLNLNREFKFKLEYSTNDNDKKVVVVQEVSGQKQIMWTGCNPVFNYYNIEIFGKYIEECKDLMVIIGELIGQSVTFKINEGKKEELWQIIFMQFSNPQAIDYEDIRRVGYTSTLKCIVNLISSKQLERSKDE